MFLLTTSETGINIMEWPQLQYFTMSAFGGDALQKSAMQHKSSFIIIDNRYSISSAKSGFVLNYFLTLFTRVIMLISLSHFYANKFNFFPSHSLMFRIY